MSVVVLAAGCAEMYGPEQESTPVVKSDGIEIALVSDDKADTDSTVTFTLTPKGEALYYSYAIEASAQDSKPDSSVVYSGALQTAVADSRIIERILLVILYIKYFVRRQRICICRPCNLRILFPRLPRFCREPPQRA